MASKKKKLKVKESGAPRLYGDWRLLAGATLAKPVPPAYPGGPSHEAGAPVVYGTSAIGSRGEEISFHAPSATAMCFSLALKGMQDTRRLKELLVYEQIVSPSGLVKSVAGPNTPLLFDMFEASILTATFCYGALEAFSNYFIGARLKSNVTVSRQGGDLEIIPEDVPRRLSLEEKLGTVLPEIIGVRSPRGLNVWSHFKHIKSVRDASVHLKAGDILYSGPMALNVATERPLLSAFFQDDIVDFPKYTLEMIEHFGPPLEGSQWFAHAKRRLSAVNDEY